MTYKGDQEPFSARTRSRAPPPPSPLTFDSQHLHLDAPVSARTISRTVSVNMTTPSRSRSLAAQIMTHVVFSIFDNKTGKMLNYGQLQRHPKYAETWKNISPMKWGYYAKELVRERMALAKTFME